MFIDNLRLACVAKGTSPTAVLKELCMSTSSVTSWKNGVTPSLGTIYKIAKYLEVDPVILLSGCQTEGATDKKETPTTPEGGERKAKEALFKKMLDDMDSGKGPKRAVLMGYGGAGKIIEMSESEYETMVKILDTMRGNEK